VKIEYAEVLAIAPAADRLTWAHDLPGQFMTGTILRLVSDDGCEGVGGVCTYSATGFDRAAAESLRHLLPELVGADPLAHEAIMARLRPRTLPTVPGAISAVDIALWDWLGKQVGLPIYQLLGGARPRIPAYASTPLLTDADAYVDFVSQLREQGFRAIKFHCWCVPERDLEMLRAVRKAHPDPDLVLMLDVENNYDRPAALRVARELEELGVLWFEAPLPDFDLEGYRLLRQHTSVQIVPAGNWVLDPQGIASGLASGAWDAARIDATVGGGITAARDACVLARAYGATCELQCWGYTLSQAANLHVMLGTPGCRFFEQPVPYAPFEYGMKTVVRTGPDGYVEAPLGPGLGVEIDWAAMRAAAIVHLDSRGNG